MIANITDVLKYPRNVRSMAVSGAVSFVSNSQSRDSRLNQILETCIRVNRYNGSSTKATRGVNDEVQDGILECREFVMENGMVKNKGM